MEWAFQANRVLLTHDSSTMTDFAQERMESGFNIAGIIIVIEIAPIGRVIEDLVRLVDEINEWENTFRYVPYSK